MRMKARGLALTGILPSLAGGERCPAVVICTTKGETRGLVQHDALPSLAGGERTGRCDLYQLGRKLEGCSNTASCDLY